MSSDEENRSTSAESSSDESDDVATTGLVATRAKRETAGNKYEATLGQYDDELTALFAEEDEGSDEYESSQDDDDDAAMDSSSSDEDEGPPKAGDAEDLAGERELKKAERAEQNRKRKAAQAKLTVPAFAKKKVKMADEAQADDGTAVKIDAPKKKPQRKSDIDLPSRQSKRASAVAFREIVSTNLQESEVRSRKHKSALHETMKKEKKARRTDLSLEDRLEKCRRIETETARDLGRFEREEAERVRLREEALMAKRRRAVEGALIRTFSTSALYENGKLKVKRLLHGSQPIEEILSQQRMRELETVEEDLVEVSLSEAPPAQRSLAESASTLPGQVIENKDLVKDEMPVLVKSEQKGETQAAKRSVDEPAASINASVGDSQSASDNPTAADEDIPQIKTSNLPLAEGDDITASSTPLGNGEHTPAVLSSTVTTNGAQPQALAPAPIPLIREQAGRCLLMLEDFPSLDGLTGRRAKAASGFEPSPVAQLLMPDSYPTFTDEEASYLRKTRKLKQDVHPKQLCALTSWEGKYRDPKTGIVYADVPAYKMLQRLIAGGCNWNSMLECWSSPIVGMIGKPAKGVPEGFDPSLTA